MHAVKYGNKCLNAIKEEHSQDSHNRNTGRVILMNGNIIALFKCKVTCIGCKDAAVSQRAGKGCKFRCPT